MAFWPTLAEGAAESFKSVVIRNAPSDPVPVVAASPVLRNGRLEISGHRSEPVPAGVVLTDLVVWNMNVNCEVRLHQGEEQAIRLAMTRDAAEQIGAELHFEKGLHSTTDRPLSLRTAGGTFCPARIFAFWSGYEG